MKLDSHKVHLYIPNAYKSPKNVLVLPVAAIAGIIVAGVSFLLNRLTALIGIGNDNNTINRIVNPVL